MLACYKKVSTETTTCNTLPEKEVYLTRDKYDVGFFLSTEHLFLRLLVNYLMVMEKSPQINFSRLYYLQL